MIKYNFGAGPRFVEGYTNVDSLDWKGVTNILWDLTKIPYDFAKTDSVDEILSIEFLEHISFRDAPSVLKEWNRILKPMGIVTIQVPDCGSMMEMYTLGEICDCVEHKQVAYDYQESPNPRFGKGKKECWNCRGKGKVNPTRWMMAFNGAQKHGYDTHKNIFTKIIMAEYLEKAGFRNIETKSDKFKWKIIATAIK